MTRRLLLVEPSSTMRHVLEKHVRALGHEVEATGSYREATATLERQFRAFESDIAGVVHGWPSLPDPDADAFASRLESVDFGDLPVVVMSTDMRAETRAWVAGRERTAVLAWKDYLGIDALLERLLDEGEGAAADAPVAKFDNADIHVLVVDDSLTIRYSLRDLFELQGYRVSLAATPEEALEAARRTRFDIAVLDFYLEETTGDALCRELVADPACGDVVCAILTGTYADHVIKRSLRAGAVECMFKHESSELLLTRIDAIARFVRQRRELADGVGRLGRVIESLAGAVLVVDAEGRLRHASATALAELGLDAHANVVGQSVQDLLGLDELPPAGAAPVAMTWRDATGGSLAVGVTRLALPGGEESLIGFERVVDDGSSEGEGETRTAAGRRPTSGVSTSVETEESVAASGGAERPDPPSVEAPVSGSSGEAGGSEPSSRAADVTGPPSGGTTGSAPSGAAEPASGEVPSRDDASRGERSVVVVERLGLPSDSSAFVECLTRYVETAGPRTDRVSLLVVGLFEPADDPASSGPAYRPVGAGHAHAARVAAGIRALYRREHHVAALGGHRHGLLIRHVDEPQSFLLTRRLMQLCNGLLVAEGGPTLASTGCLVGLANPDGRDADVVLEHALRGLEIVDARGVDQALLLDLRRMLAVYPKPAPDGATPGAGAMPPTVRSGTR